MTGQPQQHDPARPTPEAPGPPHQGEEVGPRLGRERPGDSRDSAALDD